MEEEEDMDVEVVMPVPVPMNDEEVVALVMGKGGSEKLVDVVEFAIELVPFVGETVTLLVGTIEDVEVMFMLKDVEVALGKKLNEEVEADEDDEVVIGSGGLIKLLL